MLSLPPLDEVAGSEQDLTRTCSRRAMIQAWMTTSYRGPRPQ